MSRGATVAAGPPCDGLCRVRHGFVYVGQALHSGPTRRLPGTLLLALRPADRFTLRPGGWPQRLGAALVPPLVARSLDARGVPLLSLNLHPTHPDFARWQALAPGGVRALPRAAFAPLQPLLRALPEGLAAATLQRPQCQQLFDQALGLLQPWLPPALPPHPQRDAVLAWLRERPDAGLDELARRLGLSYHRTSHVFGAAMGVSLRAWRQFARTERAGQRLLGPQSLTGIAHEAGFTDSAHLSRTWQRSFGLTPSQLRRGNSVQVIA